MAEAFSWDPARRPDLYADARAARWSARSGSEGGTMSAAKTLVRILAMRAGEGIEIALATQDGQTIRVLASEDQIDRLVDELEDILNSPSEDG